MSVIDLRKSRRTIKIELELLGSTKTVSDFDDLVDDIVKDIEIILTQRDVFTTGKLKVEVILT